MIKCSHSMIYLEGICGDYDSKKKIDDQWVYRRCKKCGLVESAKLGKWGRSKKSLLVYYRFPYST